MKKVIRKLSLELNFADDSESPQNTEANTATLHSIIHLDEVDKNWILLSLTLFEIF